MQRFVAVILVLASSYTVAAEEKMSVNKSSFGKLPDGREVEQFSLENGRGLTAKIITYGAILRSLTVPDRSGRPGEVTLGFDSLDPYVAGHPFFGATCGRVANRIAKGRFTLDGKSYSTPVNNGPNPCTAGLRGSTRCCGRSSRSSRGRRRG